MIPQVTPMYNSTTLVCRGTPWISCSLRSTKRHWLTKEDCLKGRTIGATVTQGKTFQNMFNCFNCSTLRELLFNCFNRWDSMNKTGFNPISPKLSKTSPNYKQETCLLLCRKVQKSILETSTYYKIALPNFWPPPVPRLNIPPQTNMEPEHHPFEHHLNQNSILGFKMWV